MQKTLVFLTGPPAVGKMTVGEELSRMTGMPLFHNHLSIDAILPVFPFGHPAFNRIVKQIRESVISEAAESDLPGLVFTYVWAHNVPEDTDYVRHLTGLFESRGGRVIYPELWADQATRLERNEGESRLLAKPVKRDIEASRKHLLEVDVKYRLWSDGDFPMQPHVRIDTTEMEPAEAAERIARHFGLERVAG
ncbi:MAG: AAA family ATPase [Rhodothermales bacterium]|nr:AAA family ATPase [Rhodothermales bacterium]MBO6780813.1 AAA family ATPase [Rhodothermales bacterium]